MTTKGSIGGEIRITRNWLIGMGACVLLALAGAIILYGNQVGWPGEKYSICQPLLDEVASWGQMGDFFGGVLNPLLSAATLAFVLYTVYMNRVSVELVKQELTNAERRAGREELVQLIKNVEGELFELLNTPTSFPAGAEKWLAEHFRPDTDFEFSKPLEYFIKQSKSFSWLEEISKQDSLDIGHFIMSVHNAGLDYVELTHFLQKLVVLGESDETVGYFWRRHFVLASRIAAGRSVLFQIPEKRFESFQNFWSDVRYLDVFGIASNE